MDVLLRRDNSNEGMTADTTFSQGSVLKKVDRLNSCGSIEPGTIATVCSAKHVLLFASFVQEIHL
jgi:hypothetical protein